MFGKRRAEWARLAAAVGVTVLVCGSSLVVAADASSAVILYNSMQAGHLIEARSVFNEASFGLFSSTIDQINDPTRLADIQRDELTPVLGRPSSGGDGTPRILFTGLANRADVNSFQAGGIYGMENGNLAGYLAWQDFSSDSDVDFGSSFSSRNHSEASATELLLGWGQQGENSNWGVTGGYLSRDSSALSSSTSSAANQFETNYFTFSGAYQDHSREDFSWTVSGHVASGDMFSESVAASSSFFSRTIWDFDNFSWGGDVRLNWYQGGDHPSAVEFLGSYSSLSGDLSRPMIYMEQSGGNDYDETVTRDDFSAWNAMLGMRWQKQLADGVDFGVGFTWECYEIDADFAGDVTDTFYAPPEIGGFSTRSKVEGERQSIPTSVRARIGEKWTVVAGAEFWRNDYDRVDDNMFAVSPSATTEGRIQQSTVSTGTDYAMAFRYQHSDRATAELGFRSEYYVNSLHALNISIVTLLIGLSY
ncbi:MAG: hypothetical protein Q9Q40_11990 [Acidobacteriota bacterium]|nr:hypothetical protein [Acidobacteriota bacterium]